VVLADGDVISDRLVPGGLKVREGQDVVLAPLTNARAMPFWQPMASMDTTVPATSSKVGMATISLALLATAR